LSEAKEADLIMKLAKYPEIVTKAEANYDPSEVAKYLFDLGQMFSDYYQTVPILKAEEKIMFVRLALIAAVRQVIANGLNLLGIEIINEM
jgi:arginyl-tRNA synthetase